MVARILNCKATIQVSKLDEAADKQRKYLAQVRAFRHPKSPRKGVTSRLCCAILWVYLTCHELSSFISSLYKLAIPIENLHALL
jgi:phage gp36-like protein